MASEDDVSDIAPEALAKFMVERLRTLSEEERRPHLAHLAATRPIVHDMVALSLATSSEPPPRPSGGILDPGGRALSVLYAFKELMRVLRGGGVWAAITVLLLACGWLAWELRAANQQIIEILLAHRLSTAAPHLPPGGHPPAVPVEPEVDPEAVLNRYHEMYDDSVNDYQAQHALPIGQIKE